MPLLVSLVLLMLVCFAGGGLVALVDHLRGRSEHPCACSHTRTAHEHYRSGLDCGLCPCPGFLPIFKLKDRPLPTGLDCPAIEPETAHLDAELRQLIEGPQ